MGLLSDIRGAVARARYLLRLYRKIGGVVPRECPACGYQGKFAAFGIPPRFDARCPRCGSVERHRAFALALERLGMIKAGDRVLHFAPEPVLTRLITAIGADYRSADLVRENVTIRCDIEDTGLPSESVDVVVCNHVLEHVDDGKALGEIRRLLVPKGRLLAMVPICHAWARTYENPEITNPEERELHFGQHDHLRWYGRDFPDRLRGAGFEVEEMAPTPADCIRYGIMPGETVFIAHKC
jgi:hypothetical protein